MTNNYLFEVVLMRDSATADDWHGFVATVSKRTRGFRPFDLYVILDDNAVHYLVSSKHDLSVLSSGLDGFFLRQLTPADSWAIVPRSSRSWFRVRWVRESLIEFKERCKIKWGMNISIFKIKIRRIGQKDLSQLFAIEERGGRYKHFRAFTQRDVGSLLAIDFGTTVGYLRRSAPKYVSLEKTSGILSSYSGNSLFTVRTFPYLPHDYFLDLPNFEFDKHSLIVGASGTGKSKLIELFIDRLRATSLAMNHRIVVIDPHAAMANDLKGSAFTHVVDFINNGIEMFPDGEDNVSGQTELTFTLFKSLMADHKSARLDKVLRFSLFVLYTARTMSFDMFRRFLTELEVRSQLLEHVRDFVPDTILHFFGSEYNEIRTQFYGEAVQPIVSFIDEMMLQPVMARTNNERLEDTVNENFLTVLSMNRVSMGDTVIKTVAGLIIQQMFLLAQSKAFNQKVILIVDEVSIVQNPTLAQILSEARKFNMSVILTQQYLSQLEKPILDSISSNVVNYYVFRVSDEDARTLSGNVLIDLPKDLVLREQQRGLSEDDIKVRLMSELSPRECLVRVSANGHVLPAILARTADLEDRPISERLDYDKLEPYARASLPPKFTFESSRKFAPIANTPAELGAATSAPLLPGSPEGYQPGMSLSEALLEAGSSRKKLRKDEGPRK